MNATIIACKTLENELQAAMETLSCTYPILWLESGLHNFPEKLHAVLQESLDQCHSDIVLMAMGFCGNSVVGLHTGNFQLVIPHVDDCISLLLGSMENRVESSDQGSTYFLTEGWLKGERNIWTEYEYVMEKYGTRRGERIFQTMFKHYRHIGLLDTRCYDLAPARAESQKIADQLRLDLRILTADNHYLTELLSGNWDTEKFTIIPANSSVSAF